MDQSPQLPPPVTPGQPPAPDPGLAVRPKWYWRWRFLIAGLVLLVIAVLGALAWYTLALRPVDQTNNRKVVITIESGDTVDSVATILDETHLIRSPLAFKLYARLDGLGAQLKAGSYRLSASQSVVDIIGHLVSGKQDVLAITFYPGATIYDNSGIDDKKRTDVYTMLSRAGFSDREIKQALDAKYQSPLFAGKPASASLEGYIYGDTYYFAADTTAQAVLEETFSTYWQRLKENDLLAGFKRHKLTLFQAITLASIIEREVKSPADQKQVAQVFYKRLKIGMPLGADATYTYAANQRGVSPDPKLDSEYNTRIHKGLPPGPISTPGLSALEAVARPAKGNYLYFVSGDDGRTHFSMTQKEHNHNIEKYCKTLCYQ